MYNREKSYEYIGELIREKLEEARKNAEELSDAFSRDEVGIERYLIGLEELANVQDAMICWLEGRG